MEKLLNAIQDLLDSADNTGCSEDLTVVSAEALKKVEEIARQIRQFGGTVR